MTQNFVVILALILCAAGIHAEETAQDCLYARDVKQFEILNDEMVLLHGKFDQAWLSRLDARCAGLRKNMWASVEQHGSQICAHDRFQARDRGASTGGYGTNCRLGKLEAVTPEQIAGLKHSLQASQ